MTIEETDDMVKIFINNIINKTENYLYKFKFENKILFILANFINPIEDFFLINKDKEKIKSILFDIFIKAEDIEDEENSDCDKQKVTDIIKSEDKIMTLEITNFEKILNSNKNLDNYNISIKSKLQDLNNEIIDYINFRKNT